jgi:hypothetical protein
MDIVSRRTLFVWLRPKKLAKPVPDVGAILPGRASRLQPGAAGQQDGSPSHLCKHLATTGMRERKACLLPTARTGAPTQLLHCPSDRATLASEVRGQSGPEKGEPHWIQIPSHYMAPGGTAPGSASFCPHHTFFQNPGPVSRIPQRSSRVILLFDQSSFGVAASQRTNTASRVFEHARSTLTS